MMTTIKPFRILWVMIIVLSSLSGVSQVKDACLWTTAEMKVSPLKKCKIIAGVGYRMNENFTETERFFAETGIQYKLNDYFRISGEYRFLKKNNRIDHYYATHHRYTGEFKMQFPIQFFEVDVALKYQLTQYDAMEHDWGNTKLLSCNRDKFTLSYTFDRINLTPFVFHEIFFPLFSNSPYVIDSQRTGGGLNFSVKKRHTFKLSYFIETEKTNSNRYINYITLLGYAYELN